MNKLQEKLKDSLVIFDGPMGTELYKRNFFVNSCYEQLSITSPKVIEEIHRQYADANAQVLTTNTFNANANALAKFGLSNQVIEINTASVNIAKKIAEEKNLLVAASVGPLGDIDPRLKIEELSKIIEEQISGLKEADFIIFESLRSAKDLQICLKAVETCQMPYVCSFALDRNAEGTGGTTIHELLRIISQDAPYSPTAVGLNCGGGPESALSALEILVKLTNLPIIIQPNAGIPKSVDNRTIYMASEEYFSTYARRYTQLGVAGVGGCCGITPEHIKEISRTLNPIVKAERSSNIVTKDLDIELKEPIALEKRSALGEKFANGKFVKTIEITPPRGFDLTSTLEGAKRCKEANIDAVNLPDGPRASARISPLVTAIEIYEKIGIEPILHCCCRDKSLIGLQADMLGCAGKKIHNILFITGDPPKLGDYPFSSGVFDVDSIGMVKIQSRMNQGIDLGGKVLETPTSTVIGVGADPNAIDPEREYQRTVEKIEAGANFIITQPVFDPEALKVFLGKIERFNIPVVAGVWPLTSLRNAEFMQNEVPGVTVPNSVMERMAKSSNRDDQRKMGIEIARENLASIRNIVQGVQVSAPFGNVGTALLVLE